MVKREWIRWYDRPPERTSKTKILLSIDPASKDGPHNSYSALATIQVEGDDYYVRDMVRGRFDFPVLREKTLALAERYKPTAILIEDTSSGTGLAQELRRKGLYRIKAVPVERDKVTRLFVQTAKFEAGRVHLPKDASYLSTFSPNSSPFLMARTMTRSTASRRRSPTSFRPTRSTTSSFGVDYFAAASKGRGQLTPALLFAAKSARLFAAKSARVAGGCAPPCRLERRRRLDPAFRQNASSRTLFGNRYGRR
ncbi:hypothetical protein AUC71_02970 [Methyloceanibacter marginalis]|uniref:Terminase large subunit gp17-like C-terminal domain-containing protein n=1 Tax=Methyloceanibacter marginalis TaxID=1774971 RepID=A0A1E3W7T6_9HYPH|nr:hypothetical protein AUC71_02970 [Methyloceanibacter marginalis]